MSIAELVLAWTSESRPPVSRLLSLSIPGMLADSWDLFTSTCHFLGGSWGMSSEYIILST